MGVICKRIRFLRRIQCSYAKSALTVLDLSKSLNSYRAFLNPVWLLWFFFAYIPQYRSVLDVEYQILGLQKCINKWIWQSPYLSLYQQCNLFEALEILQYATHSHTLYPSQRNLLGSCMLIVIWKKNHSIDTYSISIFFVCFKFTSLT